MSRRGVKWIMLAAMGEADNRMRWDRGRGHYEVWYLTLNHLASGAGFWVRYTLEAPLRGQPSGQLWFAYFDAREPSRGFAINRKFPGTDPESGKTPFWLRVGSATLCHGSATGSIEGSGRSAAWELEWTPAEQAHLHLPRLAYRARFADTKVLSPTLQARFRGRIRIDGRELALNGDPGCQTHLWGRKHAHSWAWSHCSSFREDPGAALETVTVRLRRLGLLLPPISFLWLRAGGRDYSFRELHAIPLTRGRWETGAYRLSAYGLRAKLEAELTCRPGALVRASYFDPDGEPAFCHNTEVADCRARIWHRRGLRYETVAELTAERSAHFEYAGRTADPAVVREHVTLA